MSRALPVLEVLALFVALQLPGLRALARVAGPRWSLVATVLLATLVVYACAHLASWPVLVRRALGSRWFHVLPLAALVAVNAYAYPLADGLKRVGRGSDQDDALILTGERLLAGERPYAELTYAGHRPSPGPGWVVLALPFTVTGLYFLLTPAWAALGAWTVRGSEGVPAANAFLLLLASSPGFWETTIVGSDMFAIGAALTVTTALAHRQGGGTGPPWGVALLAGLVATSRLPFAGVLAVQAAFLGRRRLRQGLSFLVCAGIVTLLVHTAFFAWDPVHYWPAHLFAKAERFLPGPVAAAAVVSCLAASILAVKGDTGELRSWLTGLGICLWVPLAFLALGDLAASDYSLARWQGANYLMIPLPLYLAGRVHRFTGRTESPGAGAGRPGPS